MKQYKRQWPFLTEFNCLLQSQFGLNNSPKFYTIPNMFDLFTEIDGFLKCEVGGMIPCTT